MRKDLREAAVRALAFTPQLQQTLGRIDTVLSPYEGEELGHDIGTTNVVAVVAVESWWGFPKGASPTHELEWTAALAHKAVTAAAAASQYSNDDANDDSHKRVNPINAAGLIEAVVPFVDMRNGAHASGEIDMAANTERTRVRSVRYSCAFAEHLPHPWRLGGSMSPTESMTRTWRQVLTRVIEYDLAFEAFFYHPQLGQVSEWVCMYCMYVVCMHVYTKYVCMCVCLYVYMYVCVYVGMYVSINNGSIDVRHQP
jgi:hypothetical protein